MKIALLQTSLHWEDPKTNRNQFEKMINSMVESVDLIVLPEMFSTGFTMNPFEVAETMQGETVQWMQTIAKAKKSAILGSLIIQENNHFYNRLVFVYPSGELVKYDKKHLFTIAGEDKVYTAGHEKIIIDYNGFKICPLICYDLRFPVFSRNVEEYDLLVYVANWPKPRINAWDILLKARAIENQCFVIGVNRIGKDSNQLDYIGHSQAIDFLGNSIIEPQENEGVFIVTLNKNELLSTRKKLDFLSDRDAFTLLK
jgi:omega-amidase